MDKPSVRIENWAVVDDLISHGYRQLQPGQRLTGTILSTTNLPKGTIYTSVIQNVDAKAGQVETFNTIYQLGKMDEDYERWLGEQDSGEPGNPLLRRAS